MGQAECICFWEAHNGGVYNIQFSSDENTVYSMGQDGKFCQWSTLRTTQKVADFKIHPEATFPAASWTKSSTSNFFPATPRGNLFAFESDDKFVLTCSPSEAIIYEVWGCYSVCWLFVQQTQISTIPPQNLIQHYLYSLLEPGSTVFARSDTALELSPRFQTS